MKFRLIIHDEDAEDVKERIQKNLEAAKRQNDKIAKGRAMKIINKAGEKMGFYLGVLFAWEWISDNEVELQVSSPAKDEITEKSVIGFKKFGDVEIKVVNDLGEVIKTL